MVILQKLIRFRKKIFLLHLILLYTLGVRGQNDDGREYRQLSDYPFIFVSDETVLTPPAISDSLFDAIATGIRFKVNRTELQPSDPFITLYREQLVPWLKAHDMQLRQIIVKGAASPEGPYQNNVRLSRERTRQLVEFISRELGEPVTKHPVNAQSITEDYGLLVKMMRQADDADYNRVNEVWLSCQGDEACCKRRLMSLDKGRLWRRLKIDYFPALRQARVILWFARKHPVFVKPMNPKSVFKYELPAWHDPNIEIPLQPVEYTRRHLIAARTNLLHDFLYVPQFGFAPGVNLQLEYYPLRGHYTLNAGFTFSNHRRWDDYKFFQMRDLQLELRRYFKGGGTFVGPYVGLYAEGTIYGIGFSKTKGWEGEGGGGGLSVGYTRTLNRKGSLRMEFSLSLGFFYTRYDPYVYGNPITGEEDNLYYYDYRGNTSEFKERNHRFTWFGPTNAGIQITYDIIYRKKQLVRQYVQEGGDL